MDKEAQVLIIDCILTVEIGDLKRPESYAVMSEHILNGLEKLGYRKLPDKPPLIGQAGIARVFPETFNGSLSIGEYDTKMNEYEPIAQAQRDSDIKWYEG